MALTYTIGEFRHVGIFQKNQPADNDSGGQDDNWVNIVTTRGRLEKTKGGKGIEEGSLQFNKSYVWICRYQSDLVIDQDTRLMIDGHPYQIMDFELENQIRHIYIFNLNKIDV